MLNEMRYKSPLIQSIYEIATDLHNDKGISDATYEEIRQLCIDSIDTESDEQE
jgi:hypothetical protein